MLSLSKHQANADCIFTALHLRTPTRPERSRRVAFQASEQYRKNKQPTSAIITNNLTNFASMKTNAPDAPEKKLYIIAGCNGAGKTTASFTILPGLLECMEFVNADEIAKGLSPFQPEKVAIEAGKIMLNRINELFHGNRTFAFETTLASKAHRAKIREAKANGYTTVLLFFRLQSIELAKERVRVRVIEGGHSIEADVIERRYKNGIKNLFELYWNEPDKLYIFDNTNGSPELIAEKTEESGLSIVDHRKYNTLIEQYHEYKEK